MVLWGVVAGVVARLPLMVVQRLPGRHSLGPRVRKTVRLSRAMHLGSVLCLTLLLLAMLYQEDTHALTHLKKGMAAYYLDLVPPHPDGLSTDQLWEVVTQLVTSAVLHQNITHNGTFKGVVSLRQFRLTDDEMQSFFPDCDFSRLDTAPLHVPASSQVPAAWMYGPARQVALVYGRRCAYPPEGYTVYPADLQGYNATDELPGANDTTSTNDTTSANDTASLGVPPQVVLNESLWVLEDLQQHLWVDNRSMAVLLTLLAAQPGTTTPTALTIIFENPTERGGGGGAPAPRWWSSHAAVAVDLRPRPVVNVLLPLLLAVHVMVMWFEANVPVALMLTDRREAARRCVTLATALQVTFIALHTSVLVLHFTARLEAHTELSRYYVSFDMRFNPDKYEDTQDNQTTPQPVPVGGGAGVGQGSQDWGGRERAAPSMEWDPEYKTSVRRITLARLLELRAACWLLLSLEVLLYLVTFTLFTQHHSHTIQTAMRTIRSGVWRAAPLVGVLLALLVLVYYLIHQGHQARGGHDFHTFSGAFRETVGAVLGVDRGVGVAKTVMEWVVGVTLLVAGLLVVVLFWRVCYSPEDSRARRYQRLTLHPL